MCEGSATCDYKAGSYEIDNKEVNIYGDIHCVYHFKDSFCLSVGNPSDQLINLIESLLYRFIRMLAKCVDITYDTIDFFGDIQVIDDEIVEVPTYFILSGIKNYLYVIDNNNVSNISYVFDSFEYDEVLERLDGLDSSVLESYYELIDNQEYEFESEEDDSYIDDIYGICCEDIEGEMDGNIYGTMNGIIEGDMNGDIYGSMCADIEGDMNGDIHGVMKGDIEGDMNGDIYGTMNGDIEGDMNGNICGIMKGDIRGKMRGVILGKLYGEIFG